MKKVLNQIFLFLVIGLILTGCTMKAEYGIEIDSNKNVKLQFIVAQDDEMIDALMDMGNTDDTEQEKKHTDAERWAYLESSQEEDSDFKDFKKAKYDKDGFKGYVYTMDFGNIDNLVADSKETIDIDSIDADSKIFTKDGETYKLNVKLSNDETSQMEQYAEQVAFDVKMKVTLPTKAKSNNATTVNGTTYTWDLTKASSIDLSFDFNGSSSNKTLLIVGIAAVVVICICIFLITKKKKAQN